jgi:hypothetical protein
MDDFPVGQLFAVRELRRLLPDVLMRLCRRAQVAGQARTRRHAQLGGLLKELLCLRRQHH